MLVGTLASIAELQATAKLPTPALLIMGDVVTLHAELIDYNINAIKQKALHFINHSNITPSGKPDNVLPAVSVA
ncbi:hypothetical protein [Psychrobacter cibarius]|uniref:hypothetical protein n=1 Tax=Psychrobacter cibarius TaxID=282669 RepID=UPI001D1305A9|nr:hypothetical protein [Psychrobacter cibarius]